MNTTITCVDQTITLVGELSFNTVQKLQDLSKEMTFPNDAEMVLDLGQVTKVDSSALALCLALEKRLVANKSTLAYINIPTALLGIAQSVGVQSLFPQ